MGRRLAFSPKFINYMYYMKKYYRPVLLSLGAVMIVICVWFFLEPERAIEKMNQQIVSNVMTRFEVVSQNPTCSTKYFVNPAYNPEPVCNSILFWHQNGHNISIHDARVEYVLYPSNFALDYNNLRKAVTDILSAKGFSVDVEATRVNDSWGSGDQQDYFLSYKMDNLYCSVTLPQLFTTGRSAHIPPYIEVGCGRTKSEDESVYQEFEAVANPQRDPRMFFWREAQEGDFVRLGIFNREVQSALLLKKVDSLWTSPFQFSNDYQKCSDVDRLGFPVSVYKNCMLGDYSLRYKE